MTRKLVATQIRIQKALEDREAGQGTLEYLGIVVIAALLVTAIIAAINAFGLEGKLTTELNKILPGG